MKELSRQAQELLDYCKQNGRFCPQPQQWSRLWEMLPDRKQKSSGAWNPPLPLILAAWRATTGLEKMLRLNDHIQWADEHAAIDEVDAYLRRLTEAQWFHGESSIDWEFWRNCREVKAREAVMLSVGIDPQGDCLDIDDTVAHHREVRRRLRLLLENLGNRELFSLGTLNMGDPNLNGVRLEEFAAWWIRSFDLDAETIPEPLAGIGFPLVYERQTEERRAAGRYTLEEAAECLHRHAGERTDAMQRKLLAAANKGDLKVYEPSKKARYEYGSDKDAKEARPFYEETFWTDLNIWLEDNEKRITWRFPAPASQTQASDSQQVGAGDTAAELTSQLWAGNPISAVPATAQEIAVAFPVAWAEKWSERLRKAAGGKSYKWLAGTVVRRGRRKPGDANTYNPVAIAIALVLRKDMSRAACDTAIKRHFPTWLDDWTARSELLNN